MVTGAASGIGFALASRFAQEGMRLVLADLDQGGLDDAVGRLVAAGGDAGAIATQPTDVSVADDVDALADHAFDRFGAVDVLANNAGVFAGGLVWERSDADFDLVLGVNLYGIVHGIRSFVPRMLAQDTEGHIVNTCSVAGLMASPFASPYVVSKFAAESLSECLAMDLAAVGSKLRVTALCPGYVRTDLVATSSKRRVDRLTAEVTPDQVFLDEVLEEYMAAGVDPAAVAGMVVDAIRSERFAVITHDHHRQALQRRIDQLLDGEVPDPGDYN